VGIAREPHFVPAAGERIEKHEASRERFAHARDQLDRFHRLQVPTTPTSGANTPMVAQRSSCACASSAKRQL
jgi:hypothetical protein